MRAAAQAAALASTTDWGISLGPGTTPQPKMPGMEVATGVKLLVLQKTVSIQIQPQFWLRSMAFLEISRPDGEDDQIEFILPAVRLFGHIGDQQVLRPRISTGSIEWIRERTKRMPSSLALL